MKKYILLSTILTLILSSCGLDNYDEPTSLLKGKVVHNGKAIGVKGSGGSIELQLWQNGYELKSNYIGVHVNQDGTFQALLFDGQYQMVAKDKNGPWENKHDTINFTVKGSTIQDYTVVPYYTISNETFNKSGNIVTATFSVDKVSSLSNTIEAVYLFINKTGFVDNSSECNIQNVSVKGNVGNVSISLNLNDNSLNQKFLFARVGLKVSGVSDLVYSTTVGQIK